MNVFKDIFIRLDRMYERDRWTDTHMHDGLHSKAKNTELSQT